MKESEYVRQTSDIISAIRSTADKQVLSQKARELNTVIQNALAAHTSSWDLITIERKLAQGMAVSEMADQRSGGYDMLLQERILILQNAYKFLDQAF